MEQHGWELNSFKELVEPTVNAKAKATFWPHSYACKINQHCLWSSRPLVAKADTQG